MAYSEGAIRLRAPSVSELPRLEDRVSFLFVDRARIEQGRTGLEVWSQATGEFLRTAVPTANLAVLMLGPGVSITTPAMGTLFRSGTTVVFTGADGMVGYSAARPLSSKSTWACAQARLWADEKARLGVARAMYLKRFPTDKVPETATMNSLRGLEGRRVKLTYKGLATKHRIPAFKRIAQGATDPTNIALNQANSILYGVALSVVSTLALNAALGFVHQGSSGALLYDLADLYKVEISIPAAFTAASTGKPVGLLVREQLHKQQVLKTMLATAMELLRPGLDPADGEDHLADEYQFVQGHTNWSDF